MMGERSPGGRPLVVLTQGDPAGIGPEILLRVVGEPASPDWQPLLVAERCALEAARGVLPPGGWDRLRFHDRLPARCELVAGTEIPVLDPVSSSRTVEPGRPGPADAAGALAALDAGLELVRSGVGDALVTAPINKRTIARYRLKDFRGHTDYLAAACGLEEYGRDYLMTFLTADLQVALLSTHLSLREAIENVSRERVLAALSRLGRSAGGRIAVCGLNPHAGEGSLLGEEDEQELVPAVEAARSRGIDAHGPSSPDSLFARARRGEFDWVLALYHDQGLIAVKTAAFGSSANWTLGLPVLRTSVDHGTAYEIAGRGLADAEPLRYVVSTTLQLLARTLPRRRSE